jgi:hypothetical protein
VINSRVKTDVGIDGSTRLALAIRKYVNEIDLAQDKVTFECSNVLNH